jgi:hypothetical protein
MPLLQLKRPVNHDGKRYESIEVDEPTVGAIEAFENAKAAGKSDTGAMIELLAMDTGMPADAVRKIRSSDLARITEALGPLGEDGLNGARSAPMSPES